MVGEGNKEGNKDIKQRKRIDENSNRKELKRKMEEKKNKRKGNGQCNQG